MNGSGSSATGRTASSRWTIRSAWNGSSSVQFGQRNTIGSAMSTDAEHTAHRQPTTPATATSARRDLRVEVDDHLVPDRQVTTQVAPEVLVAARLEQLERRALLLDPGVVAEVEDAVAVT